MQIAQATLSRHSNSKVIDLPGLGGIVARWLTRLFGCWHTEMSRPFTHRSETYRVCMDCGARRDFDAKRWEMVGSYYYSESSAGDLYTIEKRAQPKGKRASRIRLAA